MSVWSYQGTSFGQTESVPCPSCGDERHRREVIRRPDGLPIVECPACGLYFVDPQPTQDALKKFYATGYFKGSHDFFQGQDYFTQRDLGIKLGSTTGWADVKALNVLGKNVLDLGCASGALLVLARENGARMVKGVELDEQIAQRGRTEYGLEISVGDVASVLSVEMARFDIVSAFDLIEHVKKPKQLFEAVSGVLSDDGLFVCSVPNGTCLDMWRGDWTGVRENMEHLQYLREPDLHRLAASTGLKVDRLSSRGFPLRLKPYSSSERGGRLSRLLREPGVALSNMAAKMRIGLLGRGIGHELVVVLSKA